MPTFNDHLTNLDALLQDDAAKLSSTEKKRIITESAKEFSRRVPRVVTKQITGTNGFDYDLPTADGWEDEFSTVKEVIFPFDANAQDIRRLEPKDTALIRLPAGLKLRFLRNIPATSQSFLLSFSARHVLSEGGNTSTIKEFHTDAFTYLCASIAARALADFYSQTTDTALAGDTTDYEGRGGFWSDRADAWDEKYKAEVQKIINKTGAFAQGEWDLEGTSGFEPLLHRFIDR